MSIKTWLLNATSEPINPHVHHLHVDLNQHAEQTARERLAEWQQRAATEQAKARQIGRDYGRASRTIHALRAETALLREGLRQRDLDLRDEHSVNNELAQALDDRRPAPAPGWLGRELRRRWFAVSDGLSDDERWEQVAETAIDAVRGLWPIDHPTTRQAGCADAAVAGEPEAGTGDLPASGDNYDEPLAEWEWVAADSATANTIADALLSRFGPVRLSLRYAVAHDAIQRVRRELDPAAPQTSPGGEDTSSPQPGPSPSGDTTSDVVAKAERYGDEIGPLDREGRIASAATTLRRHVYSPVHRDTACSCGWDAVQGSHSHAPPQGEAREVMHARHVAEQLAAVGLLGLAPAAECCGELTKSCDCDCHLGGTP